MNFPRQHTLAHSVFCSGIGLHSGKEVRLALHPAPANSGIVFMRGDVKDEKARVVRADYRSVTNTQLGTTITNEQGVSVSTIEHLMAALWGCHIDNVIVELDAPEVPIMDGSSAPFVFLAECGGKKALKASRRIIEILKPVEVKDHQKFARVEPSHTFSVRLGIDFGDRVIARQDAYFDFDMASFKNDVSRARTFGFARDVEKMQSLGLARGGSLDNAVVVGDDGILNKEGLRFDDEFVRHKILDCIGDFYLAGCVIQGAFTAYRTGHELNNKLLHAIFADKTAWRSLQAADRSMPFATANS